MAHPYMLARRSAETERKPVLFVRWSPDEKEQIARASLAAMAKNPDLTPIAALQIGIDTLPPDKRMRVKDFAKNSWVVPIWKRLAQEHDTRSTQQAARAGAEALFTPAEQPETSEPEPAADTTEGNDMAKQPAAKNVSKASLRAKAGITRGMKLTRWNEAERMAITKAFVRITLDTPALGHTEALRKAMRDALPVERHRNFAGYNTEKPWLEKLLDQAKHEVAIERQANEETREAREREERERAEAERNNREILERAQREAEEQARRLAEEHEKTVARVREAAIEDFLLSAPIEDLIAAAARRLVGAFAAPFVEGLGSAIRDVKSTANPKFAQYDLAGIDPAPRGINNRPKVYVVGLIRENSQNLSKAFPNVDLAYGSNADQGGLSAEKCANADLVILMTDYVAHTVRAKVKAAAPNFLPVSGGLTSAKRCLSQWLAGNTKLAA